MNKKFVKENKKPLREFLSAIATAIIAGRLSRKMEKEIDKNPELRKQRDKVQKMGKEFDKELRDYLKKNPNAKQMFS